MESTTEAEAIPDEKEIKLAVDEMFREMNRLNERIGEHQAVIDRLKRETQTKLDALKAMF
jgi:uncharacterized small protein (DUF1192 family)